jgi:hypothetical protein
MEIDDTAAQIVERIEKDLCSRQGLSDEWDRIDPEIQQEIRDTWRLIVLEELRTPTESPPTP